MKKTVTYMSLTTMFYFLSTIAYADTNTNTGTSTNTNTITNATTNTTATTNSTTAPSIAGSYNCQWNGTVLDKSNFSLSLAKTDNTYNFEWDNNTGSPVMYGTGLVGQNNLLTSSFWGVSDNTLFGVLSITIKPDGTLQGNWISQSGKDTGTVACTKA